MTAPLYCAARDLYANGLPRGAIPNPARVVDHVLADGRVFLPDHGFDAGQLVRFRADVDGTLPTGITDGTDYYSVPVNDGAFRVATTSGGSPITSYASVGSGVLVYAPLDIDGAIRRACRTLDDMLPAHAVPLVAPYPEIITITAAELAIGYLMGGAWSKSLSTIVDEAQRRLDKWSKGIGVRGENSPPRTNTAASASAPFVDSRGWSTFGGLK